MSIEFMQNEESRAVTFIVSLSFSLARLLSFSILALRAVFIATELQITVQEKKQGVKIAL